MLTRAALYFVISAGASLILTPICRRIAVAAGFTAKPKEDRWHKKPTALFGGVAIVVPTLALGATLPLVEIWQLLLCGAAIAAFGLLDDYLSLKASTKLIVQIALASALLFFGYRLQWTDSLVGDTMLTLFWIVGITNAFNLLDNMDGLCAGTAIIVGGFLMFGIASEGSHASALLYLAALLGATAGFLVYNFNPASIFMGDTGSLFLGLNIAAITLIANSRGPLRSSALSAIAAPVLLLVVPILDTTMVTLVRILSGRRPSQGGRDHTSHRLVAIGLSQRTAVAVLWAIAGAGGGVALSIAHFDASWGGIFTVALFLAAIIFAVYLAHIRVYEDADFKRLREGNITPLVADFMYKRRVAEVLLDLCLTALAYYTAYHLRFEGMALAENYRYFVQSLPVVVTAQLLALFIVGGYRGVWHRFGMMDAVVFAKGVALGTILAQMVLLYVYRFESYSRSAFVIHSVLLLVMLCASRASFRLIAEFVQRRRAVGQRCVIYGTGSASLATIREAFGDLPLRFIGFIDDDPHQKRTRVSGYEVLGAFDRLLRLVEDEDVDCVLLNTRIIDVDRLTELEAACQRHSIELLRLQINVKPFIAAS